MSGKFRGKKALVTGGLGFIGSALARRLCAEGARVTVVDSLQPEYGGNLFNVAGIRREISVRVGDVRDGKLMARCIAGQDYLFNLAGQTSHLDSMSDPYTDLDVNCTAQLSILEACRSRNPGLKVVFASTRQIYGRPEYLPVDEKHPLRPVDVNGINKMAGERYHTLYSDVYGIRACALRLTNTIGPGMRVKDNRQTFLGAWIRSAVLGKPFEVWGGKQLRDFTYVDDAVEAFLLAAASRRADGKVFNLGGDRAVTLRDLASILARVEPGARYAVKRFPAERKRIDIGDYYADDRLIRAALGWKPSVTLEAALQKTVAYYRLHLKRYL
jgi:UDP-glucose 4-epimerase